ncbi:MAG: hypothetical protein HQL43_12135 [Alphaproteobacteria bacterium]|nr:hypothetical protein [Alphaproteobacteria bacterium]
MLTYRCEFKVSGDLVLPAGTGEARIAVGGLEISFCNAPLDKQGHTVFMIAVVTGAASSFDTAQDELRKGLAEYLDLLALATLSRYQIVEALQLIVWEPHKRERQTRIYKTVDAPVPGLAQEFLDTASILAGASPPSFARTALKYFRYGLVDPKQDDQFMRLWLALEIVAENTKENVPVPITCSSCGAPAKCHACGDEPTRIPMAKDAIQILIAKIFRENAPEISKKLFIARNGLMHGRSVESIEQECKVRFPQMVDVLGNVVRNAIRSVIPHTGKRLSFCPPDSISSEPLIAAVDLMFEHTGDAAHPAEDAIPNPNVTLEYDFRETDPQEH